MVSRPYITLVALLLAARTRCATLTPQGEAEKASWTSTESLSTTCVTDPTTQHLSDPPYENYFYSDCHSATQVIVTSPLATSDLSVIGPRLLVAWPAGNSGAVAFFKPAEGANGSLAIGLARTADTSVEYLQAIYEEPADDSLSGLPFVGIQAVMTLNTSAVLSVAILGSIRNIRDFTEGPSILSQVIQDAIQYTGLADSEGVILSRMWLDNVTTTSMSFTALSGSGKITIEEKMVRMEPGTYKFIAKFDYPQLEQLDGSQVLNEHAQELAEHDAERVKSLTFLSYSDKLLAGAWRFLTFFGRDSMITTLLLFPVLSEGEGGAIEAVIGSVLERLNQTSGVVCHEETIGDYATYLNMQQMGNASTTPGCTYVMVDTAYYLTPLLEKYFLQSMIGQHRAAAFLDIVSTLDFGNAGLTYGELALINARAIMAKAASFAQDGGQIKDNLVHLQDDVRFGQWRDTNIGLGDGRIPYDVNTALVPAALQSISALSAAGWFPEHSEWSDLAAQYAQVWEDETLQFFEVVVPAEEARTMVESYTESAGYGFPSKSEIIHSEIIFHGLSLDGGNNQSIVKVMNTDDCFRLFLLNTTNQAQLTAFLNQTATNIRTPFPVGLLTPVGLVISNPAYGGDAIYATNFTNNAYHGTVIWSWQLSMMAAGLQRQLERCRNEVLDFCTDPVVYGNVLGAYNDLWDNIEANSEHLEEEVWSWSISPDGEFMFEPLGALKQVSGEQYTESNVRQLWSLTFLAVRRDESLR